MSRRSHPARPGDDCEDEAFIRAVAARQAVRLGRPVPVDNDPATVRRGLVADRDSMMIAVAVLDRSRTGAVLPDAIDAALAGQPPAAAYHLPPGVAGMILERTPDRHAPEVFDALDAELERFAAKVAAQPGAVRAFAHLAVDRIHAATRRGIADSIAAETADDWAGHPFTDEQIREAAEATADMVSLPAILDRLRTDLLALAGLPGGAT